MVLYISKRGPHNIGAVTHKQALEDIYGEENVFEIDLFNQKEIETANYLSFANDLKRIPERIKRYLEGNIPFISNHIMNRICSIIRAKQVDLVFADESDLGNLFKRIKEQFPDVRVICFFHDIIADLFAQRIKDAPKWKQHYILELKRSIAQEKLTVKTVDECWCFHQADAARFKQHYHRTVSALIPLSNYIPEISQMNTEVTAAEKPKTILFVCSKYYVNIDGFRWFYANVVPGLKGQYTIRLVGDGARALEDLSSDARIQIVGKVQSLSEYYENANIVIVPVFDGGGMKMKTVEAISYGKCFVSTAESLNGYWECVPDSIKGSLICNCNTPDEWISACNQMISSQIHKFNPEIYQMFLEHFSYPCLVRNFRKVLKKEE